MLLGGKRPGSGRKVGGFNRVTALERADESLQSIKGSAGYKAVKAAAVLGLIDEAQHWLKLLRSEEERIRFDAIKFPVEQRDGKARQAIEVNDKRKSGRRRCVVCHG